MPRLRAAKRVSLGGGAAIGGSWDPVADAPRAKLELVKLSGDDGWHWGVLSGRREIGRLAHVRAVGGEGFWSLRWAQVTGDARTGRDAVAALARGASEGGAGGGK